MYRFNFVFAFQSPADRLERRLKKLGSIPIITSSTWSEVIEKSHAPAHPFNPGGRWRGEVTKVALVSGWRHL